MPPLGVIVIPGAGMSVSPGPSPVKLILISNSALVLLSVSSPVMPSIRSWLTAVTVIFCAPWPLSAQMLGLPRSTVNFIV